MSVKCGDEIGGCENLGKNTYECKVKEG